MFTTDGAFYGLWYCIQEAIIIPDMEPKTAYMIFDMVSQIQQNCQTLL